MISFMISVVPPKICWTRLSHHSSHNRGGERRTGVPAVQGGLHLISASRGACGAIWAAITRHGIVSPRGNSPLRSVAPTMTPAVRSRPSCSWVARASAEGAVRTPRCAARCCRHR